MLTSGQVAELLAVSRGTVVNWCRTGKVSAVRTPGGQYRIAKSEVDRILAPANGGGVARCEKGVVS
ncbi:DNA binding domain, excisionase family [Actinobaculum suis]|uniref:DNA binding domain, excisionase family n=1 Tax=Actinobaculum suis TaxID=1657 RepID=A0A7Z9C7V1_9ACTO|nr:DNA binding domain, excisionase family [Actinobaculum suis]